MRMTAEGQMCSNDKAQLALDHSMVEETIAFFGLLFDAGDIDASMDLCAEDPTFDSVPDPGVFRVPLPLRGRT